MMTDLEKMAMRVIINAILSVADDLEDAKKGIALLHDDFVMIAENYFENLNKVRVKQ